MFGKRFKKLLNNLEMRISRLEGEAAEESLYESIKKVQTGSEPLDELEAKFVSEYLPIIKEMILAEIKEKKASAESIKIYKLDYEDQGLMYVFDAIKDSSRSKYYGKIYKPQYKSITNDMYDTMIKIGAVRLENLLNSKKTDRFKTSLTFSNQLNCITCIQLHDLYDARSIADFDRHNCKGRYDLPYIEIYWN